MTKEEALKDFKEYVLPLLKEKYGNDKVAIRTAWVDYTDGLHKNGDITDNQVSNWDNPF